MASESTKNNNNRKPQPKRPKSFMSGHANSQGSRVPQGKPKPKSTDEEKVQHRVSKVLGAKYLGGHRMYNILWQFPGSSVNSGAFYTTVDESDPPQLVQVYNSGQRLRNPCYTRSTLVDTFDTGLRANPTIIDDEKDALGILAPILAQSVSATGAENAQVRSLLLQ